VIRQVRWSDRRLRILSWVVWWFFFATVLSRLALWAADPDARSISQVIEGMGFLIVMSTFPLTGLVILQRQPRNRIGWLLAEIGLVWGIGGAADTYAANGLTTAGSLPGPLVAATIANIIWAPALGLTGTFLLLLFPDGRLPSPRWRPFAWTAGIVITTLTVGLLLAPDELVEGPGAGALNPMGIAALGPLFDVVFIMLIPLLALCIAGSAVALVVRFRRSQGVERQQLKWLATSAALTGATFLLGVATSSVFPERSDTLWQQALDQLSFLMFALLPVSIGVAVLRYRLYDIDIVINRALVYGSLTATLLVTYLGSVLVLQVVLQPITERSDLAVAASTLAVAAVFGPARRRIQTSVDRRFYRHKYDAARTVAGFSSRLRQQIYLDSIGRDLVRIVDETVQPTVVSLWLRPAVTVPGRSAPRKDTP
jgi:hypothetical protein